METSKRKKGGNSNGGKEKLEKKKRTEILLQFEVLVSVELEVKAIDSLGRKRKYKTTSIKRKSSEKEHQENEQEIVNEGLVSLLCVHRHQFAILQGMESL